MDFCTLLCFWHLKNEDFGSNNSILFGKLSRYGVKVPLRYGEIGRNCVPLRNENGAYMYELKEKDDS